MPRLLKFILFGFVAGVIAVPLGHQLVVLVLHSLGVVPNPPFNLSVGRNFLGGYGLPNIANQMFWGGVWGIAFALVWPALAKLPAWLAGIICGAVGNSILGNMMLLPALGRGQYFAGWDPSRMAIGIGIGAGFGLAFGLLFGLMRRRFA